MGKIIKGNTKQLIELLSAVDKLPAAKAASDIDKHISFRRVLKKILKEYLDARASLLADFQEKRRIAVIEAQKLDIEITKAEDKKPLEDKKEKINVDINAELTKVNNSLEELLSKTESSPIEALFDNEAYLFEFNMIKENVADIFKNQQGLLDNDAIEVVFDLLDSAK